MLRADAGSISISAVPPSILTSGRTLANTLQPPYGVGRRYDLAGDGKGTPEMLRGAIEHCDGVSIGGWIHATTGSLRGWGVLAFVDDVCVGAGTIDIFRRDLSEADLGDGYCGFRFAVSPPLGISSRQVVVKLDNSDFILLQHAVVVTDPAQIKTARTDRPPFSLAAIDWMVKRRQVDQDDADFLRQITGFGFHNRSLRDTGNGAVIPSTEAKRLFELFRAGPVRVQESAVVLRNLSAERVDLIRDAAIPLLALLAPRGEVELQGLPHDASPNARTVGVIRLQCRDDRLLFVDARAVLSSSSDETARIFRAV